MQLFVLPDLFAREAPAKRVFHFEKEPFAMRTLDKQIAGCVHFDHLEVLVFQCSDDVGLVDVSLPSVSVLA